MTSQTKKPILIIGGGISGITAAVEIAEVGHEVILVEKESYLGGNVVRMNNYFPKLCPPACGLEINFRRIRQNPRIKIITASEVKSVTGSKDNYLVELQKAPEHVKDTCTACGKCVEVCPVDRPNAFNYGFDTTKAIFLTHEMAFPGKYTIDAENCRFENCGECVKVCAYGAIDLNAASATISLEVSRIITATGWQNYNASNLNSLHYAEFKNVVTNVEFERLYASSGLGRGELVRPSDKQRPHDIVFVQCAGSRDENHLPYCSAVCCSASLKHALTIVEMYPDSKIKICYIDLRVSGRNEDFLQKVIEHPNIELIKGKVAGIDQNSENQNLIIHAENILAGKKFKHETQMVVLATGLVPQYPGVQLAKNPAGFLIEEQEVGIIPVACAKKPMDVSASVKDATAAALKAIQSF